MTIPKDLTASWLPTRADENAFNTAGSEAFLNEATSVASLVSSTDIFAASPLAKPSGTKVSWILAAIPSSSKLERPTASANSSNCSLTPPTNSPKTASDIEVISCISEAKFNPATPALAKLATS